MSVASAKINTEAAPEASSALPVWPSVTLRQIGRVIRGASPRPKGDRRFYGGPIPRLMVEDVTRDGKYVTPSVDSLTLEGAKRSRPCTAGTLTIVCSGTVGIPSILAVDACIHDGFLALVDIKKGVSTDFLFHQLSALRSRFDGSATHGGVFTNLTTKILEEFEVQLPPSASQDAIARALSDADALIASLDALITKKRDIKQAAMQQLLTGKTRLPGFTSDWSKLQLFELCGARKEFFDDGDWIESEHITDSGIRLVQTGNIGVGRFLDREKRKYIFEESFQKLRCKEILPGDLLICRLADPAGRSCIMPDIGETKMVTSVDVTISRPPIEIADRTFLSYLMSMPTWLTAVSDRSGGTTHKRISRGNLGKMALAVPTVKEQTAIAEMLVAMDDEIAALEARRDKAIAVKQGMMQELLTGRVRLL